MTQNAERPELDERLMIAMRAARRHHLSVFHAALQQHRRCASFLWADNPFERKIGFVCSCSGQEQQWEVALTALQEALPEHRNWVLSLHNNRLRFGTKKKRREAWRANRKAKALLHRFLTREQRWELRGSRAFRVVGQDGRTYLVTEGMAGNVRLLENGEHAATLCVVPKYDVVTLPMYDLMLAQKILIESQTEAFLRTARVRDLRTGRSYDTGAHLLGVEPTHENRSEGFEPYRLDNFELLDIPDDVLDNPAEWVRAHVQGDEHANADEQHPAL